MALPRANAAYSANEWAFIHWTYIMGMPDESCIIRYMYSNNKRYYELLEKVTKGIAQVLKGEIKRETFIENCVSLLGIMRYAVKQASKAHEAIYNIASIVRLTDLINRMQQGEDLLEAWKPYAIDRAQGYRYQFPELFEERERSLKENHGKEIVQLFKTWFEPQKKEQLFYSYHQTADLGEFYNAKTFYSHLRALALPMQYVGEILFYFMNKTKSSTTFMVEMLDKFTNQERMSIIIGILNPISHQKFEEAYHLGMTLHHYLTAMPNAGKSIVKEQKFLQFFAETNPYVFFSDFLLKLDLTENSNNHDGYFELLLLTGFPYQKHIKNLLSFVDIKHKYISNVLYESLASGDGESAKELVDAIRQYSISKRNSTSKYVSVEDGMSLQSKVITEKTDFQETISFVLKDFVTYLKKKFDRTSYKESIYFIEFADQFVNDLLKLNLINDPVSFKRNIEKLYNAGEATTFEENRQLKSRMAALEDELEKTKAELEKFKKLYQASLNNNAATPEPQKGPKFF